MGATMTDRGEAALQKAVDECLMDIARIVVSWSQGLAHIPGYQDGLVDAERVADDCRLVFIQLLSDIGGREVPGEAKGISERVGHSRAMQGVPLADLMAAVRMDYRAMWEAISSRLHESDVVAVFAGVPRIWEAVERHSQEVTGAYMATQFGMTQVRQDERRLWFTRLLETNGRNHMLNLRACSVLSFAPDAMYIVMVGGERLGTSLDRISDDIARRGFPAHVHDTEDGPVLVAAADGVDELRSSLEKGPARLVYLDRVHGISLVPRALRVVQGLRASLHDEDRGLVPVSSHWHQCVFHSPSDAAPLLQSRYMESLNAVAGADRAMLLRTAECYLKSGSLSEVARELYCHRNTVTNRLDHLQRLTTLDLRVPDEAALFVLARRSGYAGS